MKLDRIHVLLQGNPDVLLKSFAADRALLVFRDTSGGYLVHFDKRHRPITPGYVRKRLSTFSKHSGVHILGHVVVSDNDPSVTLSEFVESVARNLVVITRYTRSPRVYSAQVLDGAMPDVYNMLIEPRSVNLDQGVPLGTLVNAPTSVEDGAPLHPRATRNLSPKVRSVSLVPAAPNAAKALVLTPAKIPRLQHALLPPSVGDVIDDYRVVEHLGSGKTSQVFAATATGDIHELGIRKTWK